MKKLFIMATLILTLTSSLFAQVSSCESQYIEAVHKKNDQKIDNFSGQIIIPGRGNSLNPY